MASDGHEAFEVVPDQTPAGKERQQSTHTSSEYTNFNVSGNARLHAGNVYNDVHNHSISQPPETESQRLLRLLPWLGGTRDQSLQYEDIGVPNGRQKPAGEWFIHHENFVAWQAKPNSWMWLYGIPGCGKTVLNAKAIRHLREQSVQDDEVIVHFYFDFRARQNDLIYMLRSFLLQLVDQSDETPLPIVKLFERKCKNGTRQPTVQQLLDCLHSVLGAVPKAFIIIDALDESESGGNRALEFALEQMYSWNLPCAHFLITSRREGNVFTVLENIVSVQYRMEVIAHEVDRDIRIWVQDQLSDRGRLGRKISKWSRAEVFTLRIEATLMERASGMYGALAMFDFHQVPCLQNARFLLTRLQLEELERCRNEHDVDQALRDMPNTIGKMYDRILGKIAGHSQQQYARDVLTWMCFARRPLCVQEVEWAIVFSVDSRDEIVVDPNKRMQSGETEIFDVCQSLVGMIVEPMEATKDAQATQKVGLAHSTVKEYLTSTTWDRALTPWLHTLQEAESHHAMAGSLLAYLWHLANDVDWKSYSQPARETREFSLAWYAVHVWPEHASLSEKISCPYRPSEALHAQMWRLLSNSHAMAKLIRLFEPRMSTGRLEVQKVLQDLKIVWFHTSLMRLGTMVQTSTPYIDPAPRETRYWTARRLDYRVKDVLHYRANDSLDDDSNVNVSPSASNIWRDNYALRQVLLGDGWGNDYLLGLDSVGSDQLLGKTAIKCWSNLGMRMSAARIESPVWTESQLPTVIHTFEPPPVEHPWGTTRERATPQPSTSRSVAPTSQVQIYAYSSLREERR